MVGLLGFVPQLQDSVNVSASRRQHRESDVWQRRFWEFTEYAVG